MNLNYKEKRISIVTLVDITALLGYLEKLYRYAFSVRSNI